MCMCGWVVGVCDWGCGVWVCVCESVVGEGRLGVFVECVGVCLEELWWVTRVYVCFRNVCRVCSVCVCWGSVSV